MKIKKELFLNCNKKESFVMDLENDEDDVKNPNTCSPGAFNYFVNSKIIISNNSSKVIDGFEIITNGNDFSTINSIKESVNLGNDEYENAMKIFNFYRDNIFHATSKFPENKFPLYLINFWGYGLCYDLSVSLGCILRTIGIKWRKIYLNGHSVNEYLINNEWVILDTDKQIYYLNLDNEKLASYNDIINDPFIALRIKAGGKNHKYSSELSYANMALFEFIDKTKWNKHYADNKVIDYPKLNLLTLFPKEKIIFHFDKTGENIIGKINIDNWINAKETALGVVEYLIDLEERRKNLLNQRIIIKTKYPIFKIITNNGYNVINVPKESLVTSFEIDTNQFKGQISVFCQGSKISFPIIKKGNNIAEIKCKSNSDILGVNVIWEMNKIDKIKPRQIKILNKSKEFNFVKPYFVLKSDELLEKMWWQISKRNDFLDVVPNFDNISNYNKTIELDEISNTFLNNNNKYYFRVKGFKDGLWSDWSEIYHFSVRKPNQPLNPKLEHLNENKISISWDGVFSQNTEFYLFGSNRLDFIPEIYCKYQVNEMLNGETTSYSENKNLVFITNSNKIVLSDKFAFYRIISGSKQVYSVPSKIIFSKNIEKKVLQIRHEVEKDIATKLGYKDFYRAKIENISFKL
jgi:hypothetical protein